MGRWAPLVVCAAGLLALTTARPIWLAPAVSGAMTAADGAADVPSGNAPASTSAGPTPASSESSPANPGESVEAGAGDTRSPGQGPGMVGAPILAILGVLALGLGAAVLTLAWIRLTGGPVAAEAGDRPDDEPRPPAGG